MDTKSYIHPSTASASKWALFLASGGQRWHWEVLLSPAFPDVLPLPACAQQSQGTIVEYFNNLRSLLPPGAMQAVFAQAVSRQACPCAPGRLALVH